MDSCVKCGVLESESILFEGISLEGIIKLCNKCASKGGIPLLKQNSNLDERTNPSVRERLSNISGSSIKKNNLVGFEEEYTELDNQNALLKRVVDSNLRTGVIGQVKDNDFLIDNFHWVVMRARRAKCLSYRQLSEKIREPESALMALEKGLVPPNSENLIRKLENFLAIRILRREEGERDDIESLKEKVKREGMEFDEITARTLTIEDMNDLREQKGKK